MGGRNAPRDGAPCAQRRHWIMNSAADHAPSFETAASQWIHLVGVGIEIFGVFIIVAGIIWSARYILGRNVPSRYDTNKISIGRSLLLGLEVLVAADIVKTIAIELTFVSLGLLAGLVVVRTFLSWTLTLEIEGRWPWQPERASMNRAQGREKHSPN
ncbi:putative membrane protein [Bradyrhizobium sp. USDA 4354]